MKRATVPIVCATTANWISPGGDLETAQEILQALQNILPINLGIKMFMGHRVIWKLVQHFPIIWIVCENQMRSLREKVIKLLAFYKCW